MSVLSRYWSRDQKACAAAAELLGAKWLVPSGTLEPIGNRVLEGAAVLPKSAIRDFYAKYSRERELAADSNARRRRADESLIVKDGVAILHISGLMMKEVPSALALFDDATSTTFIRLQLAVANDRSDVRSILILADSPGGTVDGTEALANDVRSSTKPIYVYAPDLAASAMVWVGVQGDRFSAGPTANIGSIGVYTRIDDTSELFKLNGIKTKIISSGGVKGAIEDGVEISDAAIAEVQRRVDETTDLFVEAVARGRDLSKAKVQKLATGEVWKAKGALERGLIDAVETEAEAFEAVRKAGDRTPAPPKVLSAKTQPTIASVSGQSEQSADARIEEKETTTMTIEAILAKLSSGQALTAAEVAFLKEHTQQAGAPGIPIAPLVSPLVSPTSAIASIAVPGHAGETDEVAALRAEVAALKQSQKRETYLKEAANYKFVPGLSVEQIAGHLARADETWSKEEAAELRKSFKTTHESLRSSKLFESFGTTRTGEMNAEQKLNAKARELMAADTSISFAQAVDQAAQQNKDLYNEAEFGTDR